MDNDRIDFSPLDPKYGPRRSEGGVEWVAGWAESGKFPSDTELIPTLRGIYER